MDILGLRYRRLGCLGDAGGSEPCRNSALLVIILYFLLSRSLSLRNVPRLAQNSNKAQIAKYPNFKNSLNLVRLRGLKSLKSLLRQKTGGF